MTPTKQEIKALEEDLKAMEDCAPAWPALSGVIKATQLLLKLYKGEHETMVIVPKEPTGAMLMAIRKQTIADMTGSHMGPSAENNHKAMIQASQEESDETKI